MVAVNSEGPYFMFVLPHFLLPSMCVCRTRSSHHGDAAFALPASLDPHKNKRLMVGQSIDYEVVVLQADGTVLARQGFEVGSIEKAGGAAQMSVQASLTRSSPWLRFGKRSPPSAPERVLRVSLSRGDVLRLDDTVFPVVVSPGDGLPLRLVAVKLQLQCTTDLYNQGTHVHSAKYTVDIGNATMDMRLLPESDTRILLPMSLRTDRVSCSTTSCLVSHSQALLLRFDFASFTADADKIEARATVSLPITVAHSVSASTDSTRAPVYSST